MPKQRCHAPVLEHADPLHEDDAVNVSHRHTIGLLCLLLAGCSSMRDSKINPNNWFASEPARGGRAQESGLTDFSDTASATGPRQRGNGLLAGRVIDAFNQTRAGADIQVVGVDGRAGESPVEATADAQGYFMIQNLEPGRRYRLTARMQRDGRTLAGATLATPPNAVVVIKMSEDLAGPDTPPPLPRGSGRTGSDGQKDWSPEAAPKYLHEPDRGGKEAVPRPEYQTGTTQNIPPRATIPGPGNHTPTNVTVPTEASAATPVAACTVIGNRLEDFTLLDLSGQPFHFSKQRGKLTLLDFWGTWCTPCIQGMPYLMDLQRRYAPQGFEVIGIAYEDQNMPLARKLEQVNFVRQRQGVQYKILVGEGDSCPVLNKLDVRSFPTLVLVDEQGEVIWRGEGLSAQNKARLELEIGRRLATK